jgi:heat shock protein HslJ
MPVFLIVRRPVIRRLACILAATILGGCSTPAPTSPSSNHALELPASFNGTLPCRDCEGVRAHLDLWPDGAFHLSRAGEGTPDHDDDLGRWRRDPGSPVILLYGGHEMPLKFEVVGPRTLRALDLYGKPAGNGDRYDMTSDGQLQPADLRRGLHGMFRYLADAAMFEECLTGRRYPVAMEGDYLALERAYTSLPNRVPGAPVMASFDGDLTQRPPMEGTGTIPTVVVRRFVGLWPSQTCERAMSHASLTPQYWRIVSLRGAAVSLVANEREPHLILRGEAGGYIATAGCDRLKGSYRVSGPEIAFDPPAPAGSCPAELRQRETTLLEVLATARAWQIQGQVLELFDASGKPIAVLEAVYLR